MRRRVCHLDGCENECPPRKRYCSDECRAEAQRESDRNYEMLHREERNAARRNSRAQGQRPEEHDDDVVDFTRGGGLPPKFDVTQPPPRMARSEAVVDYTKGGYSGPGQAPPRPLDMSRIPAWMRHDQERARKMAASMMQGSDETGTWDGTLAAVEASFDNNEVNFTRPVTGQDLRQREAPKIRNWAAAGYAYGYTDPGASAAAGGNAVRRIQPPPPDRGPQKTPHIIN